MKKIVGEGEAINKTYAEVKIKGDELDQILVKLSFLRQSKYSDENIISYLNITKTQLNEFDALLKKSKQVPKVYF